MEFLNMHLKPRILSFLFKQHNKQKYIRLLSFITVLSLSQSAQAVLTGPYGGLGLGMAYIKIPPGNFFNADSVTGGNDTRSVGALDGKLLLGYNFTRYAGIEVSFADYARSMYQGRIGNGPSAELRYTMSSLNITGKAYLPLATQTMLQFNAYLLGGVAEAFSNVNYQNDGVPLDSPSDANDFSIGGTDTSGLRPIFGGGISYRIKKTAVLVEIEYTRVDGTGNVKTNPRAIPNADLFTFNILYSFRKDIPDEAEIT